MRVYGKPSFVMLCVSAGKIVCYVMLNLSANMKPELKCK